MGFGEDHEEEMTEAKRLKESESIFENMGIDAFKRGVEFSEKPPGLAPEQITKWEKGWNEAAEQGDPDLNHI